MMPQPHLEKLRATLANDKLPAEDRPRLEAAIKRYEAWVAALAAVSKPDVREMVVELTALLNNYRNYLDVEVIFDSDKDFLYRQKGQIKLDNSVIEEFLPYLVRKCVLSSTSDKTIEVGPNNAFSAIYFTSALDTPSRASAH
jgi:maltooligosyltrehalose synthase